MGGGDSSGHLGSSIGISVVSRFLATLSSGCSLEVDSPGPLMQTLTLNLDGLYSGHRRASLAVIKQMRLICTHAKSLPILFLCNVCSK